MRHIVWFSAGMPSAITAMLVLEKEPSAHLVYIHIDSHHPDNWRFIRDVERWLKIKVEILQSGKYKDQYEVIEQTGYVNGVAGARCTAELKKKVRFDYQLPDDIQYFGFSSEPREIQRSINFTKNFPEANAKYPLIEQGLTKRYCAMIINQVGIRPPKMYELGYNNNNCIGCVKGGKGYWNKVRDDFPDNFQRMSIAERKAGHSCINGTFLDELKIGQGRHKDFEINCGFDCQSDF